MANSCCPGKRGSNLTQLAIVPATPRSVQKGVNSSIKVSEADADTTRGSWNGLCNGRRLINILAMYSGAFPEIEELHSRFGRGRGKIKVVIDVEETFEATRENFITLYRHATDLLP